MSLKNDSAVNEKEYKRRIRAWTMYDWANSAFATTILAAVLPVYYSQVAGATLPSEAAATSLWSMGLSISLFIVAILSPILGTISDVMRGKKRFLSLFAGIGIVATGLLVLVSTGDWLLASILFIFARIGFTGANVFYDALLPHVAREEDRDKVSTQGYALGYLGGGLLLAINVAMIQLVPDFFDYAGSRLSLLSVAIWWAVFSIPVLRRVPEPPGIVRKLAAGETVLSASFSQIWATMKDIRRYRELFKFLVTFLIYNDGIGTIIGVAVIYGSELGFGDIELILALLLVQFVGIPFSLIFGRIPSKDTRNRPQFLAFVVFNIIALPLVALGGRYLLPADITGDKPEPYVATGDYVGEGVYLADSPSFSYSGGWTDEVIPAEALSGGGFIEFVNTFFGDPLEDVTYKRTDEAGASYDFAFNGQEVDITYSVGPDHGSWAVLLDGESLLDDDGEPVRLDGFSDTVRYGEMETFTAGEPGEHVLTLQNTDGSLMTVAGAEVLPPVRQNNLLTIILLILGTEVLCMGLAALLGRPLFAKLAEKLDTKRSIMLALIVYAVIAVWGFFLDSTIEFWFLAWMVAIVQGGSQALSRSLYASMSPAAKSGEFFGLFGIMEKFSAILGPILFAAAGALLANSRPAILSLIIFFVAGIFLLTRVDADEGRRVAQEEDARLLAAALASEQTSVED
nr:MFS transporter [Anaerolineae bacterium]